MKSIKTILIESQQMDRFSSARNSGKRTKGEEQQVAKNSNIFFRFPYKDWKFESTIHAAAQEFDRRPDMLEADWKIFHTRVHTKIVTMKPISGEFIFYSSKYQQGYVAAVDFNTKNVRVITVLPKGKSKPKPGTVRFFVEGIQYDISDLELIRIE